LHQGDNQRPEPKEGSIFVEFFWFSGQEFDVTQNCKIVENPIEPPLLRISKILCASLMLLNNLKSFLASRMPAGDQSQKKVKEKRINEENLCTK